MAKKPPRPDENRLWGPEFDPATEPFRPGLDPWTQPRDPFFAPRAHEEGQAYYDAWRIEDLVRSGQLQRDGYRPGDEIRVTWEDRHGRLRETTVDLPRDWRRHDAWSEFYAQLRDFYYPLWEEDTGNEYDHEGGYVGSATAG